MVGGEIYVKKIPSMKLPDIALAVSETAKQQVTGVRPGEKLHEQMIGTEDALYTLEYDKHYKILPQIYNWRNDTNRIKGGKPVSEDFTYTSDNNKEWMTVEELRRWIEENRDKVGEI
jgi:FlaA1/EpsC-like NDP-sugar epimerase